jgi:hypothetical protein
MDAGADAETRPFRVSRTPALDALPPAHSYVLAVDGMAVHERRNNGVTHVPTYKTRGGAERAVARISPHLPGLEIVGRT